MVKEELDINDKLVYKVTRFTTDTIHLRASSQIQPRGYIATKHSMLKLLCTKHHCSELLDMRI